MKNVIYVFALLLIAFCSCSSKNEYTSIVNQFVELNKAMGVPKETVGVLIANVKSTIKGGMKSYKDFFRTLETHCASATAKLTESIKHLQENINDSVSNINNWNKNLQAAKKDMNDAASNVAKGKKQLTGLRARIAKLLQDYQVYAIEADKKLTVVKVLRDIITDELLNRSPGALVQVTKFHEKLAELKSLLNNNSDSLYAPMISVLLDLATEQNFSDQGVLRKILQNLKNLDKSLRDFRAKQEAGLKTDIKNVKKDIKTVKSKVRAYRRMYNQAHSKVIDATHYISFYRHEVEHFTSEKNRQTDELSLFKKLCDFERSVHNQGVAAFKKFKTATVPHLFGAVQKLHSK